MEVLILVVADAYDRRNMLRNYRRLLRDAADPFYLPEARFIELFRLNKDAALILLNEISPFLKSGIRITFIPKNIRMAAALHFYATGSFLRDIGQDFVCSISKSMMCLIVKEVTYVIQDKLMGKYIVFPTTLEHQNRVRQRFYENTNFPGVIGAIDCTHVKIKKPTNDIEYVYRNRKGYFSKNVQLISDYDLNILDCYARFGSSSHDAFIWENSKANAFMENQYAQNSCSNWLIGDSGYPLQPWLMTPFRSVENESQSKYNCGDKRSILCRTAEWGAKKSICIFVA